MPGVSREEIARAKEIGIEEYILSHEPNNVKRVGNAYYLKDHDSLEISNGLWNWHSHGVGGKNVVDYLIKVRGYDFVSAVRELAGDAVHSYSVPQKSKPPPERKPFALPPRNRDNERVIAYLMERGIDRPLILGCIERGSLYESGDGWHNCIFIGRDERGKAKFAAMRSTEGDFKRDADGSDKAYGFVIPPGFAIDNRSNMSRVAAIFESPIDALSHQTLYPDFDGWRLSLGCTALAALTRFLEVHPEITHVVVGTDNDEAGNLAAAEIGKRLGITVTRSIPPAGKDWNEALQSIRNEVKELEDVRKDIIFRDSDYREKFRIKDGDSIKITVAYDGEVVTRKCRWIDECHTQIGSESYHNDEYAEKSAKVGNKTEPVTPAKPQIDILAAKYGEDLQAVTIPMTEAALRKLVGGKYETETLCYPNITNQIKDRIVEIKGKAFGAVVRGKDGIAVCGLTGGVLTSLHPYNAQTQKRALSPAERPAQETLPKKTSLLDNLEKAKAAAAEQNAANASGDRPKNRGAELD
jgi:hypothetical protein